MQKAIKIFPQILQFGDSIPEKEPPKQLPHEEAKELPHEEKKELPHEEHKLIPHEEHALLQQKHSELEDQLKRLQAEFENFRKRTEKEKKEIADNGKAELLSSLLPVLDDIEEAKKHVNEKGMRLLLSNLEKALFSSGLEKVPASGKLDLALHEVAGTEPGEEDGRIIRTIRTGYSFRGRVLRPALVLISKKE